MDLETPNVAMRKKMMLENHFIRVLPYKVRAPDAIIPCFLGKNAIRKPFVTQPPFRLDPGCPPSDSP